MTTIRDVARRAGVSATTVSHVINRTRKVDAITAARVEAAIGEMGYRPNALARSMRRGRTHTVGVILPDIANPFFGDLGRWLEDALFEAGYSAIICNSDGDERKEVRYLDVLLSKKVDGLLLVAASQPSEQLRHLVDTGPPTIVVDRELDDLPVSQVMVANQHGGRLAGQHLVELGHRSVGVIAGPGGLGTSARRLDGFRSALAEAGIAIDAAHVERGDFRAAGGRSAMEALLALRPRPSAVFAENDLMALGALSAAHAAGLEDPPRPVRRRIRRHRLRSGCDPSPDHDRTVDLSHRRHLRRPAPRSAGRRTEHTPPGGAARRPRGARQLCAALPRGLGRSSAGLPRTSSTGPPQRPYDPGPRHYMLWYSGNSDPNM